jgi:hypothetical protein
LLIFVGSAFKVAFLKPKRNQKGLGQKGLSLQIDWIHFGVRVRGARRSGEP